MRLGRYASGATTAEDLELTGPFRIERRDNDITLVLPKALRMTVGDLIADGGALAVSPFELPLGGGRTPAARARLARGRPGGAAPSWRGERGGWVV